MVERNDPVVVERTKDPTYVRERTAPERVGERREEVASFMPVGSMLGRVILTLFGAALLIVGAMLDWVNGIAGTSMSWEAYYRANLSGNSEFITSAGAIVIGIAILGLIGLATRGGWLIRLAGALGIVAFVLFLIQAIRADVVNAVDDLQVGMWLVLAGGIVTVIGGFFGGWRTVAVEREHEREAAVRR
ncbi:MAG: sugar:proton symporter [Actinobacteria bacterium]|nr:MAG: sugar:proton symporter [Actinomycetota bacterium]